MENQDKTITFIEEQASISEEIKSNVDEVKSNEEEVQQNDKNKPTEIESLEIEEVPIQPPQDKKTSKKLLYWQIFQITALFITYSALYICYGALSVGSTKMQEDPTSGVTVKNVSIIMLITKTARFIPKLVSGSIVDMFGGKRMYVLGGLISSVMISLVGVGLGFYWVLCFWVLGQVATYVYTL